MLDPTPELQDDTPISSVGFSARIQNVRAATGLETVGFGAGGVVRYEFQSAGPRKEDCDPPSRNTGFAAPLGVKSADNKS